MWDGVGWEKVSDANNKTCEQEKMLKDVERRERWQRKKGVISKEVIKLYSRDDVARVSHGQNLETTAVV